MNSSLFCQCRKISAFCILLAAVMPAYSAEKSQKFAVEDDWYGYVSPLENLGEHFLERADIQDDEQARQELYRFLYLAVAQAAIGALYGNTDYPDFWGFNNLATNIWAPNPDDVYYLTPIDQDGVYKISGHRGTVRILTIQVGNGPLVADGSSNARGLGNTLSNYDVDRSVSIDENGFFDVVLSKNRPLDYEGDWWELKPGGNYIVVRQISYDWVNEIDGRLAIERLDVPAMKPRPTAEEIATNLRKVASWAKNWADFSFDWGEMVRSQGSVNKFSVDDLSENLGGIKSQRYMQTLFDINSDEALIIETDVPECRYWNFQMANLPQLETLDWMNHQTTLNGHSAKLDSDGRLRIVVSIRDPGVPNWLDTVGYKKGFLLGRWKECDSNPVPSLKKVKVDEVRRHLPKDTPIVTEAERDQTIRLRRKGAQFRRRW
jgi:hypothetical protein